MTRTFPSHDAIFLSIPRRIIGKLKDCCGFRCIPIIGAICLVVQIILLTTQRDKQCVGCPTNNNLYLSRIWNFFSRGYEPLLPLCPRTPPDLLGTVQLSKEVLTWAELESKFLTLQSGGRYKPVNCTSRHRVAIIIPCRERDIQLKILLNNLHPVLQRQQLDYGIFVVDLDQSVQFNRALLLNVGAVESLKLYDFQCFIFHDVDLLPENDHNIYSCPENPRHMSVAVDIFKYKLPYGDIFGGVTAISKEHFYKLNGYSNRFFGWGGEDDDMFNRINMTNLTVTRYPADIARYTMLRHARQDENLARFDILRSGKVTHHRDGINTLKYDRLSLELRPLFTYIMVNVNQTEIQSGKGIRY